MSGEFLLRKLRAFGPLSDESSEAVLALGADRLSTVAAGCDIISEGDDPKDVYLIVEGWACRYKMLEDGRRQIIAFFVPGDLCDLHVYILRQMDHSIAAVTPVKFAKISAQELEELGDNHPRVLKGLWWETLVTASIQREWTVNIGQRDALEALAHLCCELYLRLRLVGLVDQNRASFPLTQVDIADALGLTPTHVGRIVRMMNKAGLITLKRKSLTVNDLPGLQEIARYNPNYLHQSK
jgi:CRP-like cAMP-binding protein